MRLVIILVIASIVIAIFFFVLRYFYETCQKTPGFQARG